MARIAFVLGNDFEDAEFETPHTTFLEHDLQADVIGSDSGDVTGKHGTKVSIDKTIDEATADDYDVLVIPGGFSPDHLRTDDRIVEFVRAFGDQDKVIAVDGTLITSRNPDDLPAFTATILASVGDVDPQEIAGDNSFTA